MMQRKTHDYFTVLKSMDLNFVTYVSQLELTAHSKHVSGHSTGTSDILFRKRIRHKELDSLSFHRRSGGPNQRVANVSFVIKGKVAEMEIYYREHSTPLSSERRINTLILAAFDLKKMGCNMVLTHVFIPGRTSVAGKDEPVMMNIDDWIAYLRIYKSPGEFSARPPL